MSAEALRSAEQEGVPKNFVERLDDRQVKVNSLLCVGLDPDFSRIPEEARLRVLSLTSGPFGDPSRGSQETFVRDVIYEFNTDTIAETYPFVCAYKPNSAYYEEHGPQGLEALKQTVDYIRKVDPTIQVILDAKRTDIGSTNEPYARMAFDWLGVDALTVNPYFGGEAIEPFLNRVDKGIIVLCRTSNLGAKELQDLIVKHPELGEVPLYQVVAHQAETKWNKNKNVCLVVGATYPEELSEVRKLFSGPILIPGLGAQGGRPEDLSGGFNPQKRGIIANNGRGIIFKSSGPDFAQVAGKEAQRWRDAINIYR